MNVILEISSSKKKTYNFKKGKNGEEFKDVYKTIKEDFKDEIDLEGIYIYKSKENIPYPKKDGRVLYVGEVNRAEKFHERFIHIRYGDLLEKSGDSNSNYTLGCYYDKGTEMSLEIYIIDKNKLDRKNLENLLIQYHAKIHGAVPIANGLGGPNHSAKSLNSLPLNVVEIFE